LESVFYNPAKISIDDLNKRCENTLNEALGIKYSGIGIDFLEATMPVNEKTIQPRGILNGGASLALIESLGSMAANLAIDSENFMAVGQNVSGHHFKPAFAGETVLGRAHPLHLGKKSQIWEVSITNADNRLICKGTITMAVLKKGNPNV
jgi:1,4-dihydroxy-2-naphthoyl-CoA hydrolase